MLAVYGYQDGSGEWFITIDTGRCAACPEHPCVGACPAGVLETVEDDYGEVVVAVRQEHRRKVKDSCAACRPQRRPCLCACPSGAVRHSW